jgi:hypothetical protein
MIDKRAHTVAEALGEVADGATVLIGVSAPPAFRWS